MKSISTSDILKILSKKTKKILWILGLRAFLLILLFILADLIMGGFVFYKYVYLAENKELKVTENILKFDSKTYQNVLEELQTREQGDAGLVQ